MVRSKQNVGKINRFFEALGVSRASDHDDERASPEPGNFFSSRENLGRFKTTKELASARVVG